MKFVTLSFPRALVFSVQSHLRLDVFSLAVDIDWENDLRQFTERVLKTSTNTRVATICFQYVLAVRRVREFVGLEQIR